MSKIQRLAVTPGEPAGVGPDLIIKLAQRTHLMDPVVIADPDMLLERAQQLDLPLQLIPFDPHQPATLQATGQLHILPVTLRQPARCGIPDSRNAEYVLETLQQAVQGCQQGDFAALVTGPIHKGVINDAGIPFTGHTEFLAQETGTAQVVMMLVAANLRVALATTHLPICEVSAALTEEHLSNVLLILHQSLISRFHIPAPNILICGLNPHAGEQGHLGREEIEVIEPVIARLRSQGLRLTGPLPADTIFTPQQLSGADAVLAMYHDQGLPVLKHVGFGQAVNITLGLPFVRTSVDHGTALDLAGTGKAETGSLESALQTAMELVRNN